MRTIRRWAWIALAFLMTCRMAHAQKWEAGVFGTLANLSELGYGNGPYNASWIVGASAEYDHPIFRATLSGDWSPANKVSNENDWSSAWDVQLMKKVGPYVLVRGGLTYSYTHTSLYQKTAWRGSAGLGLQTGDGPLGQVRFYADHLFHGTDSSNGLEGERYTMILRPPLHVGRLWFTVSGSYGYYRFHESNAIEGKRLIAHVYSETVGIDWRF